MMFLRTLWSFIWPVLFVGLGAGMVLWLLAWPLLASMERLLQAVVAGTIIACGWVINAIYGYNERAQNKSEKLRDYHKALYAEISHTIQEYQRLLEWGDHILDRLKNETDYVPLIPREGHDHIYNIVAINIEILPRETIDGIVRYYNTIKALQTLIEDMRGEKFGSNDAQDRRIAMYEDYLAIRRQACEYGNECLSDITTYADGKRRKKEVSNQVADQSAQS